LRLTSRNHSWLAVRFDFAMRRATYDHITRIPSLSNSSAI